MSLQGCFCVQSRFFSSFLFISCEANRHSSNATQIHQASCTSGHWRCYVGGVKKIITVSLSDVSDKDGDFRVLLDWIYYHDVLERFSKLHYYSEEDALVPAACSPVYPWANVCAQSQ